MPRPRLEILLLIGLVALLMLGGVAWLWSAGKIGAPAPDPKLYPVRGIDVSHHQGVITWGRLPRQGIGFVYVKASEGADLRDPLYRAAAVQAREAGLQVGAYHFFTLCRPGDAQAANFVAAAAQAPTRLPPAVDLEYLGNCRARPSREAFARELDGFIGAVERATGRRPILYATPRFYRDYLAGEHFADAGVWMRTVIGGFEIPRGAHVVLRQYAANGRLDGVDGPVDLNAFIGSKRQFEALLAPEPSPQKAR